VGNNSVIDFLRRRGVSVVHLSSNMTISGLVTSYNILTDIGIWFLVN